MDVFRTPEERFTGLPEFPWEPHYLEVGGLRIAYLDEGEGDPVLLMHGEPSWSFLYRKMIPPLVEAGFRVLVPDLVGFGRSDKPTAMDDYTYQSHVDWMSAWLEQVDAEDVTFFGQDWGGLIGLRLVTGDPDRFRRVAVGNTFLPTGDQAPSEAFLKWQAYAARTPDLDIGWVIQGATVTELPPEVVAGYDAPFPEDAAKAGARIFPALVPIRPDDPASEPNRQAWEVLRRWEKPFLCLFSDSDPVTAGGDRVFQKLVPGAAGQPHHTISNAGHFLQEDAGPELARRLIDW